MAGGPLRHLLRRLRERTGPSGPGGVADADLLERFVSCRDEAALEVLFWRHGPLVWGVCRRVLRHEQDAEDAFQATFLTLVRKAGSVARREALAGWLYRVAYRIALAARSAAARRDGRERPLVVEPAAHGGDDPLWCDLGPVLDEEVNRLPAPYRSAVVLCYLQGLTNDEAAAALGCSRGTVASRLARARQRLRRRLGARGLAPASALLAAPGNVPATVPAGLVTTTLAAARGSVSARVAALTEGALRAMALTRLKIALALVLVPAALVAASVATVGLYRASASGAASPTEWAADPPAAAAPAAEGSAAKQAEPEDPVQAASRLIRSQNNLKAIGLALANYSEVHGHFPAPAIYGKDGTPLLSWRVALLPFVEQDNLYKQFKLDQPWDGPINKKLLEILPAVYVRPGGRVGNVGLTYYQAFVGKGAGFESHKRLLFPADFTDGLANTIGVVEAATPVPWTKPEDLSYDADKPLPRLGGLFGGDFNALFFDGSVRLLSKNADPKALRAAITRNAGDVTDLDKLLAKHPGGAGAINAKQVERTNARLKEAVDQTLKEVDRAREDVGLLKARLAHGQPDMDATTTRLLEQTEELQKALQKALQELDALKEEKARLEKELSGGSPAKPTPPVRPATSPPSAPPRP
jgi:RNA polymerase sigma factor (sigma-70 family)